MPMTAASTSSTAATSRCSPFRNVLIPAYASSTVAPVVDSQNAAALSRSVMVSPSVRRGSRWLTGLPLRAVAQVTLRTSVPGYVFCLSYSHKPADTCHPRVGGWGIKRCIRVPVLEGSCSHLFTYSLSANKNALTYFIELIYRGLFFCYSTSYVVDNHPPSGLLITSPRHTSRDGLRRRRLLQSNLCDYRYVP